MGRGLDVAVDGFALVVLAARKGDCLDDDDGWMKLCCLGKDDISRMVSKLVAQGGEIDGRLHVCDGHCVVSSRGLDVMMQGRVRDQSAMKQIAERVHFSLCR